MTTKHLSIEGMHCAACVQSVENALGSVNGVDQAAANLLKHTATVQLSSAVADEEFRRAIEGAGYTLTGVSEKASEQSVRTTQNLSAKQYLRSLQIAGPLALLCMIISMSMMFTDGSSASATAVNIVLFALTLPVIWSGRSFFSGAWKAAKHGHATMDTLVAIGSGAAFLYSTIITFSPTAFSGGGLQVDVYFDTAAMIITLILFGKWLEARAKSKTADALEALLELRPPTARVIRNGEEQTVNAADLVVGDEIVVRAGEQVPTDGQIIDGQSTLDESMMTGESMPVSKTVGDTVTGGTQNASGVLKITATAVGSNTVLASIISAVERAQESKAPLQRFADSISAVFVPIVIGIAAVTFIVWMLVGPDEGTFAFAMNAAIAVLIIACPCALGLATPTAISVGSGKAASKGILFTNAESLEVLSSCEVVVLDKTGTITSGTPVVKDVIHNERWTLDMQPSDALALAASLEQRSEHPIASAIVSHAHAKKMHLSNTIENVDVSPGLGITAEIGEHRVRVGSEAYMTEALYLVAPMLQSAAREMNERGETAVFVAVNGKVTSAIGIADTVRETSKQAIAELNRMGKSTSMASGDSETTANAIAGEVGISTVYAGLRPLAKQERIRDLVEENDNVVMVGDGINDSPALAEATVGVALGGGTDIAKSTADVTLVRDDLMGLVEAFKVSSATVKNIKQNLFFAFFYNVLGIPIAAGVFFGLTGWLLSPMVAAGAMALSSVTVVTNALRLKSIT